MRGVAAVRGAELSMQRRARGSRLDSNARADRIVGPLDGVANRILTTKPFRRALKDPHPTEQWEIWYDDTFDRDAPSSVDVRGRGLAKGLAELWARHFFESVRSDGQQGFSSFQLHWKRGNINILGDREGAKRLRDWLFGKKEHSYKGYVAEANSSLLNTLAHVHARLIDKRQVTQQMLAVAVIAKDRKDFEDRLYKLIES
jgi:hypothetical protein